MRSALSVLWFLLLYGNNAFAEISYPLTPLWLDSSLTATASPPREYFSVNTFNLDSKAFIHIGHDLINQNYVIFPTPSVEQIQRISADKSRVFLRLYHPEAEAKILATYTIQAHQLLYLYITSLQIFDQKGLLIDQNIIPPGVHYHPPQTYQIDVANDVKILNFVVGFTGRSAWSDSGVSSDLQGIYREFADMKISREASLELTVNPGSSVKAYEVYTSGENQSIKKILSNLHLLVAWGRLADKEELINQIATLKNFQEVSIDLSKGVEDLKKYPHLFGNPVDPKYTSVLKKAASEKLTEQELNAENSYSAKLGLGSFFSAEGSSTEKRTQRYKDLVKFDLEGEFYIPKALNFSLRAKNSFELIHKIVFHAYSNLEEVQFLMGTGVQLKTLSQGSPLSISTSSYSPLTTGNSAIDYHCHKGSALAGMRSTYSRTTFDNEYQFECRKLLFYQEPLAQGVCTQANPLGGRRKNVHFECSGDSFLTGIASDYVVPDKDRIARFTCCALETPLLEPIKKGKCQWSGWINPYEQGLKYSCPAGTIQGGMRSEVDSTGVYFGRRFDIECCETALF